jgi:hypothetical protein
MSGWHIDVFGLTLAELAFVVLFAFLVAAQRNVSPEQLVEAQNHTIKAQKRIEELDREVARLHAENQELGAKSADIPAPRPGLRSQQTPSCSETGFDRGFLFTALIVGPDMYSITNVPMNYAQVIGKYRDSIDNAKKAGCIHRVQVVGSQDLNIRDYDVALQKLERHFYVRRLGAG